MPYDLVIFDCDGVLVDSEAIANRVWVELLAEHGLTVTSEAFLRRSVGTTLTALYEGLRVDHGWVRPPGFDATIDERLGHAFGDVRPIAGVPELLESLDVPFCVASNSREDRLHLKLEVSGLAGHFDGRVFHAGMVARGKPEPDLFLHAAGTLGADPAHCLVVEDSLLGTTAGIRAGMEVWGFTGGAHALPDLRADLESLGVARVFDSMADLREALVRSGSAS